jgi:hypothetical protein
MCINWRVICSYPGVQAKTSGRTGVEMEALTAASVAALTIYDMCNLSAKVWRLNRLLLEKNWWQIRRLPKIAVKTQWAVPQQLP